MLTEPAHTACYRNAGGTTFFGGVATSVAAPAFTIADAALPRRESRQNGCSGQLSAFGDVTIAKHTNGSSIGCVALAAHARVDAYEMLTCAPLVGLNCSAAVSTVNAWFRW